MIIRAETEADFGAITAVNDLAFGETVQSEIIQTLRQSGESLFSLVADQNAEIVGHIMFYRVLLDGEDSVAGLGPISVHPHFQKQGIGGQLVRAGLKQIDTEQHRIIFLLGHTSYYPRFGFSSELGAQFISPWPRPAFMGLRLNDTAPESGTLTFPKAYL